MNYKPILIVPGEPNSVFFEIFFKALKKKFKSPIVIVGSINILNYYMKIHKIKIKINKLNPKNYKNLRPIKNSINLIDVEYKLPMNFKTNISKSQIYLEKCFKESFRLIKIGFTNKFINGPISKEKFLKKKYLGLTEYISDKFKSKKNAMLIYNPKLSVCPLTTHLPLKLVTKKITKKKIYEKVFLINDFYKQNFNIKPKIGVLGLNPHCESISKFNEDKELIKPTIEILKKLNYKISGPFPADTCFLKQNRDKFDVIIGMYHDQVLTPMKTIFEYDAINITLGLPFIRISPDHGPNEKMIGKNKSNPLSLIKAISFLDRN